MKKARPAVGQDIKLFLALGNMSPVTSLAFSSDGKTVISGSLDKTLKIWEVATEKEIISLVIFDDNEWFAISPDGYFNASSDKVEKRNIKIRHADGQVTSITDEIRQHFYCPNLLAQVFVK